MLGYLFAWGRHTFPRQLPVGSGVVTVFDTDAALVGLSIGAIGGLVGGRSPYPPFVPQ